MNGQNAIEQVADALLYEGYMLYPYRLSSVKNRYRWNFGVLYPQAFANSCGERARLVTECLVEVLPETRVTVNVRFLAMADGMPEPRRISLANLGMEALTHEAAEARFDLEDGAGRISVRASLEGVGLAKLTVEIDNVTENASNLREEALTQAAISTHVIISASEGRFLSSIDPPDTHRALAANCQNEGLWPVLADPSGSSVLSAPIILYDCPAIAEQSPGDLFDGTEIDEILTLRIRSLTDGEKNEMRSVDARTRALLERSEDLGQEELTSLHATMRSAQPCEYSPGDRVRLRPQNRADAFDVLLRGMLATVVSVEYDFEGNCHVCVTIDEDPGKDLGLEGKPGHRFFYSVNELERV